jgi:hypothetical protein
MRDMASEDSDGASATGVMQTFGRGLGAVISLGLLAGIVAWSWQLYSRDVGDIPVIRAELEPMRVAPEDPGGEELPHQGLSINRVIEGEGVAEPNTDVALAPLPETPVFEEVTPEPPEPSVSALEEVPDSTDTVESPEPPVEDPAPVEEALAPAPLPVSGGTDLAPRYSLPSPERPEGLEAIDLTRPSDVREAPTAALRVEDIPTGSPVIQLGAFNSTEIAVEQWGLLLRDNEDILGPHRRFIQPVMSSGRRLYRLRVVGFDDLAEAQSACAVLQARRLACIPTVQR